MAWVPLTIRMSWKLSTWLAGPGLGLAWTRVFGEDPVVADWVGPFELRKLHIKWSREPVGFGSQDSAMTTMHFIYVTNTDPLPWPDPIAANDLPYIEDLVLDWWELIRGIFPPFIKLDQLRWYADGPDFHPTPAGGNPALRVTEVDSAGGGSGSADVLPPQVAMTITEKTSLRSRWGRMYLPAPMASHATQYGSIDPAIVDSLNDATITLFNDLAAGSYPVVVWSPTSESAFQVTAVQIDDLFDVIRSRRWSSPSLRDSRVVELP